MALAKTLWEQIVDLTSSGQDVSDNLDIAFTNIDLAIDQIDALVAPTSTKYVPQSAAPTYSEGQTYYDNIYKSFAVQTDVNGYELRLGTDLVVRVINKTGIKINAGQAIRNGGIDAVSGEIKAELAKADSLATSFVIGFAAMDIAIDAEGWVVERGHVHNLDTSLLLVGKSLFLSDTVAGGVVQSPPDIASALGTVTEVNALTGSFFAKIDNLITYPQATGVLRGQNTPLYAVTTVAQDIVNFIDEVDIILTASAINGTFTVPLDGHYQITFTSIPTFVSSTSTRTLYFELYNETLATVIGAYPRNIPRDATEEGMSFTAPLIDAIAGHTYKMRVRASLDVDITFSNMAFMLNSNFLG